jgi:hypothetical protein
LNALELQVMPTGEECFLSLNAIYGSQSSKVIHLRALVGNQVLSILVDSGSSRTFLNSTILTRVKCIVVPTASMPVRVSNGQVVLSDKVVQGFEWWIQGLTFSVDARVLDLAAYDMILGMNWLELYRPMTSDLLLNWIQFEYQGSRVTLQGIVPSESATLSEISGEQIYKLAKGHDIWALVVAMTFSEDDTKQEQYMINGIPGEVQKVIHDHADPDG